MPKIQHLVIDKFLKLQARITSHNPRLDEDGGEHLRWIDRMTEDFNAGIVPERRQLERANELWLQYK